MMYNYSQMLANTNYNDLSNPTTSLAIGQNIANFGVAEIATIKVIGKVGSLYNAFAKGGQTVIGEGMKRVINEAAKRDGSVILNNMPNFTGTADQVTSQMMTFNRQWLLQQMRSGRPIIDIGLDPNRGVPSIFYQMEQNMIKNYLKLHSNAFQVIKP